MPPQASKCVARRSVPAGSASQPPRSAIEPGIDMRTVSNAAPNSSAKTTPATAAARGTAASDGGSSFTASPWPAP